MRAGLSTIQQTLTNEASTVLTQSIAEAGRRNHGQTTPLHVAATLLASPSNFLRQACIRSHPNSSHPLQCRALELCFSVALERLPAAQSGDAAAGAEPPISNALMAALKRAQAHQRRGCPEQQQQPLLAVKVELEQLIISILDDPSVSRVMREASFSSPAVKTAIEQSLTSSNSQNQHQIAGFGANFGSRISQLQAPVGQIQIQSPAIPNRNLYLNPLLQQQGSGGAGSNHSNSNSNSNSNNNHNQRGEEVNKILDIMSRSKKRNPILVGDSELETIVKEFLAKIDRKDGIFKNVQILPMNEYLSDKSQISSKMNELGREIEGKIGNLILDLGDLKWLVEQPVNLAGAVHQHQQQQIVSEIGRSAVIEMGKLLSRFEGDDDRKVWLIGTATCETYLRCQVYHSTMENDWDLQAVPIAARSPIPGMFPRLRPERILSNPMASLSSLKTNNPTPVPSLTTRASDNSDPAQKPNFCPKCTENYEKELTRLTAIEKSLYESQLEDKSPPPTLPWLQKDQSQGLLSKQKTQELQKKWRDTCLNLHPPFHQTTRPNASGPPVLSMANLYNPNFLSRPPFQPILQTAKPFGSALQLNTNLTSTPPAFQSKLQTAKPHGSALQLNTEITNTPPRSPVRTELALGPKGSDNNTPEKDFLSCFSTESRTKILDKFSDVLDVDTYKKLLKGLMEKAWWQAEAASAVASAITRCRLGNGKRRGNGSRGDIWLLFTGPDRVGKKKMAAVLARQICNTSLVTISLGAQRGGEESFRGKTVISRISEAIRGNPFSVVLLEDIDEADMLVRGSVKRAIERGRLVDSSGREIGLGNAVFILTGDWSSTNTESSREGQFVDEKKIESLASRNWQLGLIVREKSGKRKVNFLEGQNRQLKRNNESGSGLNLDLNLAVLDDQTDCSDLTVDLGDDLGLLNPQFAITSVPLELASNVDDSIVFKPVDFAFVRREIKKTISVKFSMILGDDNLSIEVGDDVLERILGGIWHDRTGLEEWVEEILGPSFEQLKPRVESTRSDRSGSVVRLVVESDSGNRDDSSGNWLPSTIQV